MRLTICSLPRKWKYNQDCNHPQGDTLKYNITGDNLQCVNVEFSPGEVIYSEAGSMVYMSGNVRLETKAKGGVMSGLKRAVTGESFFVTNFHAEGGPGMVGFGGNVPGKIVPLDLRGGKQWLLQKTAFLAAEDDVTLDIAFQKKFGAALFGGEGLILQKVQGEGTVFVAGCGDFIEYNLAPGQVMKVSTANTVAWESSVQYDIQSLGIKTALFGGEGLFVTTLRGPGRIILQTMTMSKLANSLVPFLPDRK
ncbi:MAG TPA: TIGR00266 family protein [Methanomassiliicoccales archaeon]|nr:TIGR00266 family protein [Methanomassiliicoccales archaeon]